MLKYPIFDRKMKKVNGKLLIVLMLTKMQLLEIVLLKNILLSLKAGRKGETNDQILHQGVKDHPMIKFSLNLLIKKFWRVND